jgi:DNA-binding SARP family transcriptional activator
MTVEVRILGPLELVAERRAVSLGGRRESLVLALIAARAPQHVSAAQLIEDVWGQAPQDGAAVTLRSYVSRLREAVRSAGAPPLVLTRRGGYALASEGVRLDADEFALRCEEATGARERADRREEMRLLDAALTLWRGPALADCAGVASLTARTSELQAARALAFERWAEAALECGEHERVAARLPGVCDEHRLRERLWASLMLALYRCGRQAEALDAYRSLYARLRDELGIEPGAPIRELQLAILRQDELGGGLLRAGLRAPAGLPFVGRERELALLRSRFSLTLASESELIVLSGEPGIGKTTLASEWGERARELGAQPLYGRCEPVATSPFSPLLPALAPAYALLSEAGRRELGSSADALERLFGAPVDPDGLADRGAPEQPRQAPSDGETARAALFRALVELVRALARSRPLVLILEELHWAERSSLALMSELARGVRDVPLLTVMTCRDERSHRNEALIAMLRELAGEPRVSELQLGGLSEREVLELLRDGGQDGASLAHELHAASGGNPLFVRELLANGDLTAAEGVRGDVGALATADALGVRDVIARRLRALPDDHVTVLTLAAVIGREFDVRLLEAAGAGSQLIDALEAAEAARMIEHVGQRARERYGFVHELIRVSLLDPVSGPRLARLHERIALALERVGDAPAIALAEHYAAAARPRFTEKAGAYAQLATEEALRQLAFSEAAGIARRGLDALALDDGANAPLRCELQLLLGQACMQDRDVIGGKLAAERAGQLARELGDRALLIRAAIVGSYLNVFGEEDEPTARLCADAVAALREGEGEDAAAAEVYAGWADYIASSECAADRAEEVSTLALAAARRCDSPAALSRALFIHGEVLGYGERIDEREQLGEELLSHGERELDVRAEANALHQLALVQLERAELERFDATFARLEELCERAHWWFLDMFCVLWRGMRAMLADELSAVEPLTEELLSHAGGSADVTNLYLGQLFILRREQRRSGELLPALEEAVKLNPGVSAFRCALALACSEAGETQRARAELTLLIADDFALIGRDMTWSTHVASIAEVAASVHDRDAAAIVWPRLLPYGGRLLVGSKGMASYGAADRLLGWLAATLGDFEESERRFDAAVRLEQRIGSRLLQARTEESRANALLLLEGQGDRRRAAALRASAHATLLQLGVEVQRAEV